MTHETINRQLIARGLSSTLALVRAWDDDTIRDVESWLNGGQVIPSVLYAIDYGDRLPVIAHKPKLSPQAERSKQKTLF